MKVGDYVRTKKGTIYQFNSTSSKALSGAKKYMVKSSPRIIDLIEAGDYVNGFKMTENDIKYWLEENNVKSIVTKESFENISYKVGE